MQPGGAKRLHNDVGCSDQAWTEAGGLAREAGRFAVSPGLPRVIKGITLREIPRRM